MNTSLTREEGRTRAQSCPFVSQYLGKQSCSFVTVVTAFRHIGAARSCLGIYICFEHGTQEQMNNNRCNTPALEASCKGVFSSCGFLDVGEE